MKQRSQGENHVRANDNGPQPTLECLPTQPHTLQDTHETTGHSEQSADTNYGGLSNTDPGSQRCHDDIVTHDWEEGKEMASASYHENCCRIWCGDDVMAGSENAVTVTTIAPSEKRLHKLGQVYIINYLHLTSLLVFFGAAVVLFTVVNKPAILIFPTLSS